MAARPAGLLARVWPALLLAVPLGLAGHHFWVARDEERRGRLEAERTAAQDSLKALQVAWAGELELTWKPQLQLGGADSLGPGFVRVAIDRAGQPRPAGIPPELARWLNPAEAAPPARVDNWLATRVTTTTGRRWLLARALPAGTAERSVALSNTLGRMTDETRRRKSPAGYLRAFLLAWLVVQIPFLFAGRRRS